MRPDRKSTSFPKIPGVRYQGLHNRQLFLDYGSHISRGRMDIHPPRQIANDALIPFWYPKSIATATILPGLVTRSPSSHRHLHGWNLLTKTTGGSKLSGLLGSFIPLAKTKAERNKLRDPRLSLQERYKNHNDYVKKVSRAARILVDQRYLLPDDAERMINEAKKRRVP